MSGLSSNRKISPFLMNLSNKNEEVENSENKKLFTHSRTRNNLDASTPNLRKRFSVVTTFEKGFSPDKNDQLFIPAERGSLTIMGVSATREEILSRFSAPQQNQANKNNVLTKVNPPQTMLNRRKGISQQIFSINQKESSKESILSLRQQFRHLGVYCLVYPDDKLRIYWNAWILVCLASPFRLAFFPESFNIGWLIMDTIIDFSFIIDIISNFFSAYHDLDDNLVLSKKKIAINYIFGWFVLDVLSSLPTTMLFEQKNFIHILRLTRIPKLFQMIRLFKLTRFFKLLKNRGKTIKSLIQFARIGPVIGRLFLSIFVSSLVCHIITCLWVLTAKLNDANPDNWIFRVGFQDKSVVELYIYSFYWTVQTVLTVGYGDPVAVTLIEKIFACAWMFAGVFVYSFFVGSFTSLLTALDKKRKLVQINMSTLQKIKKDYLINDEIYNKTKNSIKLGAQNMLTDYQEFLDDFSDEIRLELSYYIYGKKLEKIEYFKNKTHSFLATIGLNAKPFFVEKGDFVYMKEDPAEERKGSVAGVLPEHKMFEFLEISEGFYFGEVEVLKNLPQREYTVMAKENCELYILNKRLLREIYFEKFKEYGIEMAKDAMIREYRTEQFIKEARSYCKKRIKAGKLTNFAKNRISAVLGVDLNNNKESDSNSQNLKGIRSIFSTSSPEPQVSNIIKEKVIAILNPQNSANEKVHTLQNTVEALSAVIDEMIKKLSSYTEKKINSKQYSEASTQTEDNYIVDYPVKKNNFKDFSCNTNIDNANIFNDTDTTNNQVNEGKIDGSPDMISYNLFEENSISTSKINPTVAKKESNFEDFVPVIPFVEEVRPMLYDLKKKKTTDEKKDLIKDPVIKRRAVKSKTLIGDSIPVLVSFNQKKLNQKQKIIQETGIDSYETNIPVHNEIKKMPTTVEKMHFENKMDIKTKEKIIDDLYESILKTEQQSHV